MTMNDLERERLDRACLALDSTPHNTLVLFAEGMVQDMELVISRSRARELLAIECGQEQKP